MKKIISNIVITCIVTFNSFSQSGKNNLAKAEQYYNKLAFVDAITTYERIFSKGYKSQEMLQKLGNSYYFKADLVNAAKWYGELFQLTQKVAPEYYYRYSQSLKAIKNYEKADEMLRSFNQKSGNEIRAKLATSQKNYLELIKKNSGRYTIKNAVINSKYSDYGSTFWNNKLIFTSARDTTGLMRRTHRWTGESFTNLYSAELISEDSLSTPKKFGTNLNSKFNESTPVFTKDGKTIYFTRNNYLKGKKGKDSKKSTLLKIYKANLVDNQWTNITDLPFDNDEYDVAHPTLSDDEKTLYFASNMPGTLGQSDLYKVAINSDGTYGKPINLGNVINTEGRETFPMITSEGELYFSSDGHPGLGGLDIFVSKLEKDGSYKKVLNVGEPLNSSLDDFGFIINEKTKIGYITSNRDGGIGGDDIYQFKEIKKIDYGCEQLLTGMAIDIETKLPLINVKISLSDENYNTIKEVFTDKEGKFYLGIVDCQSKYYLKTNKNEYTSSETLVITTNESGKTYVPIEIEKTVKVIKVNDDLCKVFGIKTIYFDLDKSCIRTDAAVELAKILDVLEQNSTMEIDIRSHTDCRNTANYNLNLSNNRAKSTLNWFVEKGINKSRLTARGYGETQLLNNCACEPTNKSNCTEEEHQINRRSEFIIKKL
jgi:outer membrane protein OmpA-like peptidoglycan-associated protein/tetratricopeptide (TPR) repeat protein